MAERQMQRLMTNHIRKPMQPPIAFHVMEDDLDWRENVRQCHIRREASDDRKFNIVFFCGLLSLVILIGCAYALVKHDCMLLLFGLTLMVGVFIGSFARVEI